MRIIDLSVPMMPAPSEATPSHVRRRDHAKGAKMLALSPALDRRSIARTVRNAARDVVTRQRIRARDLPGGLGLAWETLWVDTHHGTHVDAPWHYGPTCAGRPARTIEELPLEWFVAPGVRLDLRDKPAGAPISPADLQGALHTAGHELAPREIVLVWTGADAHWGHAEYLDCYCGLDEQATRWLLDRGVKVIGTDAWSLDRPARAMARDFARTRDPAVLWPAHFVGRDREYCQIEKLAHLGELPGATGYTVACFPVAVRRGSAGWTRAVAILQDAEPTEEEST